MKDKPTKLSNIYMVERSIKWAGRFFKRKVQRKLAREFGDDIARKVMK